jgi:signal transduction histidine kinase
VTADRLDGGARLAARLAARTAHDLNNVSAVLSGHIYLLHAAAEPPEEAFAAMEKALEHLDRLSKSLASLGMLAVEGETDVDLNQIVRAAAEGSRGVELDLAVDVGAVRGRPADLGRAVSALIANAVEASGPELPVSVSTRRHSDGGLRVVVADRGEGVPGQVLARGFAPLVSTREVKGRGIGLCVAAAAAALSGGELSIEAREGGGTSAVLRLPPSRGAAGQS